MGALRFFAPFLIALWLSGGSAHAEKRVALVIGNSAYKTVAKLSNPTNDATLIGGMFKKAGFDLVEIKLDVNASEMRRAFREFGNRTRDADVAVIYYAGHGIELDGTNYLIPTDASLESDGDVLDETIALDRALYAVEPAKQLRLIILDACRDNPFSKTMRRTMASRAIGRGLAKVEPTSPNTMIAFAAKAGSTASDGDSKNSPFAVALADRLPTPGLDLRKAFGFVRDDVLKATAYKQEPYVYGSLGGDDVPLVPLKPVATATGPQANPQDAIRRDYELALQIGSREVWTAFLEQYPDGFYASLAKGQLNRIAAEETRAAAAEKARQAEDEKARLVADRARKADQEKAAAAAKAAEDARLAAEKAKQAEEAKAAAAEQRRKDAEAAAAKAQADKQAAEKALADKLVKEKAAAEATAKQPAEQKAQPDGEQKIAVLAPTPLQPGLSPQETTKLVQSELRRVGCLTTPADGDWNASSQRSLTLFNKYAGMKLDTKLASVDTFDAIKAKQGRVCPLICDRGFKADGDACVKITCRAGFRVNDDNECERIQDKKPVATRDDANRRDAERKQTESKPAKPQTSGQIFCAATVGCRPVRAGCRLEFIKGSNVEVCN
ncbi:caspase (peptidase) [Bradyrhizobium guangdongense]|uniref:caspase family protein n=1 Tax=Bradyrhizobium guangdongense TaxID=1325090 RepID=UPI00112B9584|nr:caspase family protein [Bradyrhizobium guangdongense]TPQ32359.1 caspase (peptidase) [Bradyrhizobium guangdongense]